jgi:hypothetical protein
MKLSAAARQALPAGDFAGPGESFPIPDVSHGRFALAEAKHAPDPAEIRAKVHAKFPQIDKKSAVRQALLHKMGGK